MSLHTKKGTTALPALSFNDDLDTGLNSDAANTLNVVVGAEEVAQFTSTCKPVMCIELAIAGGSGSTGVFASMANPLGASLMILGAFLQITTQSSGASTLDIGVGANATTSNDGLIDGLSAAAAGLFTNAEDAGTNGEVSQLWTSSTFLNVAEASGDVNGLVATLRVLCVLV